MAEYALRLTNGTDTAPRVRRGDAMTLTHDGPLSSRGGIRPDGGGVVSVIEGAMSVEVTPLLGWVQGAGFGGQGGYPFVLDATKTLDVAPGDATQDRVDTVAVVVNDDQFDGSGATDAAVVIVQGTPGLGAPALPGAALPLRDVLVPAGASAGTGGLSASNLGTDRRTYLATGVLPVSGVTERDAVPAVRGMVVHRGDTGRLEQYDGSAWQALVDEATLPRPQGDETVVPITGNNNPAYGSLRVVFDPPFTEPPLVQVTPTSNSPEKLAAGYTGLSATEVTLTVARTSGGFSNAGVSWYAAPR